MSAFAEHRMYSLSGADPEHYRKHLLHGPDRIYSETNCYTDIVVELLHACGYEPLAMFGHLVRLDFEGDQWTFFKPPPEDLELLFGVDIHEMQPYRPLPLQIAEQLERERTMIVELDSWHLPDTMQTSYRREHVKTSVAVDAIDPERGVLRYFHNSGLHELAGDDYRGVFRLGELSADVLPPYVELVRFDLTPGLGERSLREASAASLRRHLALRSPGNPFERFASSLVRVLPQLLEQDLTRYHAYAFATARMAGSGFEIASSYVQWLLGPEGDSAAAAMREIVAGCKALSFKLARRRPFQPEPLLTKMAEEWQHAMAQLDRAAS